MSTPQTLAVLLLATSALTAPSVVSAQESAAPAPDAESAAEKGSSQIRSTPAPVEEDVPEISAPGAGDIVVVGRRDANIVKSAPAVISVLSSADIARTGEGNIAGALGRVTGLSVVGNGFVYVRGLGDRYSLALLNGSPLPSPEPLKRVVPLDIFPTNIVSSSLVQKSYSVNYPGEFGGGVINLTTTAVPKESFVTLSGGIGANTETTGRMGYVYYGSGSDWTGFDNGARKLRPALSAFLSSGQRISDGTVDTQAIAGELVTAQNALVQRWGHVAPNYSATLSAGRAFDLGGDTTLGVIATAGYSNKWQTRETIQQKSLNADLAQLESDYRRVSTDNRIVVNGLIGLGLEFGDNKARWTTLYIRDTLKNTRMGIGKENQTNADHLRQDTAWYARQLFDTQVVGEFRPMDGLSVDVRAGYAKSQRKAPYEMSIEYLRSNAESDPFGSYFINRLNNGNNGDATISFSTLDERLWSAGLDAGYSLTPDLRVSAGYAFLDTKRDSTRRDFQFSAPSTLPAGVDMMRPDYLLSKNVIDAFKIALIETNEGAPAFRATLRNHAGYGKINWQLTPTVSIDAGVRYETAKEQVAPLQVFTIPSSSTASTNLNNDYWLPAATLTWQVATDMQVRLNGSKTIARPQFRELLYQFYFDPDTNRQYRGNPMLQDSELTNAEARWEYYFAREQRVSVAGFFKRIKRPIETYITGGDFVTSFANAPKANLYGAEAEVQKYFDLSGLSGADMFVSRRFVTIANYTYTKSKLKVGADDTTTVYGAASNRASDYFRDGAPLTGQSDHLVNLQLGLEDTDSLSQQTFILSYASKRVTSRGLANQGQPDVFEYPGFNLDFVARQGIAVAGLNLDLKVEARNITNRRYREQQTTGTNTVYYNRYRPGASFNFSVSAKF